MQQFVCRTCVPTLAVSIAVMAWSVRGEPLAASSPADVIQRFAVPKDGVSFLLLPVELKGKRYLFALDTGSSFTSYDSSLVGLLGNETGTYDVETPSGGVKGKVYKSPDARLGRLSLRTSSPVGILDFQTMREFVGDEIYGFIGMDFLKRHIVRIDLDRGEVVFLRSVGPDPGRNVPLRYDDSSRPVVDVSLRGLIWPEPFVIDTACVGLCSGVLQKDEFDTLVKLGALQSVIESKGLDASGERYSRTGTAQEVVVADNRHRNLNVSPATTNALGIGYWSRYVVTFDFPRNVMYLKPSNRFDQPDLHNVSGMLIERKSGKTFVGAVRDGTPAAGAGLRRGDAILTFDGDAADTVRLMTLRLRLCACGKKARLLVSREGKQREVVLDLPAWKEPAPAGN